MLRIEIVSGAPERMLGLESRDTYIRRPCEENVFSFDRYYFASSRHFLCVKSFES